LLNGIKIGVQMACVHTVIVREPWEYSAERKHATDSWFDPAVAASQSGTNRSCGCSTILRK